MGGVCYGNRFQSGTTNNFGVGFTPVVSTRSRGESAATQRDIMFVHYNVPNCHGTGERLAGCCTATLDKSRRRTTSGQPNEMLSPYTAFYRTASETVIVDYATGFPCGIGEKYSQWRVSKDTVEGILVTPFKGFPISELLSDENSFEKRSGGHRAEDVYYMNDQDGESIRVFHSEVMDISFYSGRVDVGLSCSELRSVSSKPYKGLTPPVSYTYVDMLPE